MKPRRLTHRESRVDMERGEMNIDTCVGDFDVY